MRTRRPRSQIARPGVLVSIVHSIIVMKIAARGIVKII